MCRRLASASHFNTTSKIVEAEVVEPLAARKRWLSQATRSLRNDGAPLVSRRIHRTAADIERLQRECAGEGSSHHPPQCRSDYGDAIGPSMSASAHWFGLFSVGIIGCRGRGFDESNEGPDDSMLGLLFPRRPT
eukprot:scaffold536394_cov28-Prasinocladus_malaysianus.AAC.1